MGWADAAIDKLRSGERVVIRPRGNSMSPRIRSGQEVLVSPCEPQTLRRGDVALVTMPGGRQYLHLVVSNDTARRRVQIANNRGHVNGWAPYRSVHGVARGV